MAPTTAVTAESRSTAIRALPRYNLSNPNLRKTGNTQARLTADDRHNTRQNIRKTNDASQSINRALSHKSINYIQERRWTRHNKGVQHTNDIPQAVIKTQWDPHIDCQHDQDRNKLLPKHLFAIRSPVSGKEPLWYIVGRFGYHIFRRFWCRAGRVRRTALAEKHYAGKNCLDFVPDPREIKWLFRCLLAQKGKCSALRVSVYFRSAPCCQISIELADGTTAHKKRSFSQFLQKRHRIIGLLICIRYMGGLHKRFCPWNPAVYYVSLPCKCSRLSLSVLLLNILLISLPVHGRPSIAQQRPWSSARFLGEKVGSPFSERLPTSTCGLGIWACYP